MQPVVERSDTTGTQRPNFSRAPAGVPAEP